MQVKFVESYSPEPNNEDFINGFRRSVIIPGVIPESVMIYGTDCCGNVIKQYSWAENNWMGDSINEDNFAFGPDSEIYSDEVILPDDLDVDCFYIFGLRNQKGNEVISLGEIEDILDPDMADVVLPEINRIQDLILSGEMESNDLIYIHNELNSILENYDYAE